MAFKCLLPVDIPAPVELTLVPAGPSLKTWCGAWVVSGGRSRRHPYANNTPVQWGQQMASHLGGTQQPHPTRRASSSPVRQLLRAPTVLEAIGLPEPTQVDGVEQEAMDAISFAHLR